MIDRAIALSRRLPRGVPVVGRMIQSSVGALDEWQSNTVCIVPRLARLVMSQAFVTCIPCNDTACCLAPLVSPKIQTVVVDAWVVAAHRGASGASVRGVVNHCEVWAASSRPATCVSTFLFGGNREHGSIKCPASDSSSFLHLEPGLSANLYPPGPIVKNFKL